VSQARSGSPFVFDASGKIVGIHQPDGSETLFAFLAVSNDAPVDGVQASLATNMTNLKADITWTAVAYGTEGNSISVVYLDPGAASQALKVYVIGRKIYIKLATGANSAITSTGAQVVAAVAACAEAAALVTGADEDDGSGVVNAVALAPLTGGIDVTPGNVVMSADGTDFFVKMTAETWVKCIPAA